MRPCVKPAVLVLDLNNPPCLAPLHTKVVPVHDKTVHLLFGLLRGTSPRRVIENKHSSR